MTRLNPAFALGAALIATSAAADPPGRVPGLLDDPRPPLRGVQVEPISAAAFAQFYPKRAQSLRVDGTAEIRCLVAGDGALSNCIVIGETPEGFGFGQSALRLAQIMKLKPETRDGKPVAGGIFQTRLSFKVPAGGGAPHSAPPPSG